MKTRAELLLEIEKLKKENEKLKHFQKVENAENFRILSETLPTALMIYQNDYWVYANDMTTKITGYSNAELLRMKFWEIVHPDYRNIVKNRGRSRQKGSNNNPTYEFKIITKAGKEKWVLLNGGSTIFNGKPAGIITVTDIEDRKKMQQKLKESINQFKFLSTATFEGIAIHKMGKVIDCNESFLKLAGYKKNEIIGKNMLNYIPAESDKALVMHNIVKQFTKPYTVEAERKDGSRLMLELEAKNVKHNGEDVRIAAIRDVTDKKRAADELKTSEKNFRQLAENIDQVFWLTDWKSKKLLYVSPSFEKVFELTTASAYKDRMNWLNLIHPEDKDRVSKAFNISNNEDSFVELEYRIITKSGKIKWLNDKSYPIYNENGELERFVSIAENISERKEAEENLEKTLRELEAIFKSSLVGIMVLKNRIITKINDEMANMLGYKMEEIVGKGTEQLHLSLDNFHEFGKKFYWRLSNEEIINIEYPLRHKNGQTIWCQFNGKAIYPPDLAKGAVWIIRDITEIKKAQNEMFFMLNESQKKEREIKKLLTEKELILREVHHRIKNNMATIESILKIHTKQIENEQAKFALNDAIGRIKSMRILYEKLFHSDNFIKVDSFDYIAPLIDEIITVFPQKNEVEIIKEIESFSISAKLIFPLGIIINEIITNIMKYAFQETKEKRIFIKTQQIDDHAELLIQDNGIGFPADFTIEKSKGFGLQLVHLLAQQLKAEIKIEQQNGAKVIFRFKLDN